MKKYGKNKKINLLWYLKLYVKKKIFEVKN